MTHTTGRDEARQLVARAASQPVTLVAADAVLEHLPGWDSLKHLQLVLALEARLGRPLAGDEVLSTRAVGDVERLLRPLA